MAMNATKHRKKRAFSKRALILYCMMLPGILYFLINNYVPMAGLVIAFKRYNVSKGLFASPWAGLSNFTFLLMSNTFSLLLRNTLAYNACFIILGTLLGIVVAILLNEVTSPNARRVFQTSILIPFLMSFVVISYIVYAFLSPSNGMINNSILAPLGVKPIDWYSTPKYWPVILVIVNLWKSFGYISIIYYATIVGIDQSYYEAAVIDGAGVWQQITHVTLPLLAPTITMLVLLNIGRIFYSDFGLFYQVPMDSGLLYSVTTTIDTYVYRGLVVSNDVARASAAGFFQSIMGFIMILLANTIVRKYQQENALF